MTKRYLKILAATLLGLVYLVTAIAKPTKEEKQFANRLNASLKNAASKPLNENFIEGLNHYFEDKGSDFRIEGDGEPRLFKAPKIKRFVRPVFPTHFLHPPDEATVHISFILSEDGEITSVEVFKSTDNRYDENVVDAVKRWEFVPASYAGHPVPFRIVIPYRFELSQ